MAKVKYLSSFDELTWSIDFGKSWIIRCNISWEARGEVRNWISSCCSDTVWIWNGTSAPPIGGLHWEKIAFASIETTYIIFEHVDDSEMFLLKYASKFEAKFYGNDIHKAWHESRS